MRLTVLALCLAGAASPIAVQAQTYRFDVADQDATLGGQPFSPYYFFLDKSPAPGTFASTGTSFTIEGTTHGTTYSPVAVLDTFTFYTEEGFGGFDDLENIYAGAQLFTGATGAPTFRLGTFQLDNFGSGATLTISASGGVPEPATWALMIAGFGAAGAGMRRSRRPRVDVAYG